MRYPSPSVFQPFTTSLLQLLTHLLQFRHEGPERGWLLLERVIYRNWDGFWRCNLQSIWKHYGLWIGCFTGLQSFGLCSILQLSSLYKWQFWRRTQVPFLRASTTMVLAWNCLKIWKTKKNDLSKLARLWPLSLSQRDHTHRGGLEMWHIVEPSKPVTHWELHHVNLLGKAQEPDSRNETANRPSQNSISYKKIWNQF